MGWIIIYGKDEILKQYTGPLKGISNIFLMPHTIVQFSVK
jgi:hypothetical protein